MSVRPAAKMLWLFCGLAISLNANPEQRRFGDYWEALPVFWQKLYPEGGETLYCGKRFGARHGRSVNIEHVFPMAWVMRDEGCRNREQCRERSPRFNRIEADLHNLYPALKKINKIRSSFPFGEIEGERRQFGPCDFEFHPRRRIVEPRPESRGNIARAMFHMHESYGLKIFRRQAKLLKRWHREDPPDQRERHRNDRIAAIQGTRNRFIDNPDAVNRLKF